MGDGEDCQRVCEFMIACYEEECGRELDEQQRAEFEMQCFGACPIVEGAGCGFRSCQEAIGFVGPIFGGGDICDEPDPMDPICDPAFVEQVFPGASFVISNAEANNAQAGNCSGGSGNAVPLLLIVDVDSVLVINTTENTFDTVLSVRTVCDDAGSEIECNDDGGPNGAEPGFGSEIVAEFPAGEYYLWLHGYMRGQGEALLTIDFAAP